MLDYQGIPMPTWAKFTICVLFDLFDFTIGRLLLGVSILGELGTTVIMFVLWGPIGLFAIWESVDFTEQLDGFVPTNTLIAIAASKKQAAPHP
ncbi:hypothetical protein [Brevundimonas sp.]|jgi:hypothetical protein|uniref:hypothetical protein n=1 Tax=Brevundimonas sp. TaxID=1871086 RepID=UPI00391BBA98